MKRSLIIALASVLILILGRVHARANEPFDASVLAHPRTWALKSTKKITDSRQLAGFSKRLSATITRLENHFLDAGGIPLQVNCIQAATEAEAAKVAKTFLALHKDPLKVAHRGLEVFEFLCQNRLVLAKARSLVRVADSSPRSYKVRFAAAPLKRCEAMSWNPLFNVLMALESKEEDKEVLKRLADLSPGFAFQEHLVLPHTPRIRYTPGLKHKEVEIAGGYRNWVFKDIPSKAGVPRLPLLAQVTVRPFTPLLDPTADGRADLKAATKTWPAADASLKARVAKIIAGAKSEREKAERILAWIHRSIRYSGKVVGSRYGVAKVLEQGYGHCWDKSDVFVTFCRAAGLPTRQLLGWLRGVSGHVWAEVYCRGEGWIAVDPTASWLGCSGDYVPLYVSEDGAMPFVYWSRPRIESIKSE